MKVCSVSGCGSSFRVIKGLCNKHTLRLKRHGAPTGGRTSRGAARLFLEGLKGHAEDACVIWPFARDGNGYARIRDKGGNVPAHRVACEQEYGPPPTEKHHATHNCGNGPGGCVNPKHLEWGTAFKNQQDRVGHGTSNRGERCASHKLSEDQVVLIHRLLLSDVDICKIAALYSVSPATILDIKLGRTWFWLTGLTNPTARDRDGNLISANDNHVQERNAA